MPVDGYPGPTPYIFRGLAWIFVGTAAWYMLQDRGTYKLKEKMEKEGRAVPKEKEQIKLMMERLQNPPSNLKVAKEETDKQRREWAKQHESYTESDKTE